MNCEDCRRNPTKLLNDHFSDVSLDAPPFPGTVTTMTIKTVFGQPGIPINLITFTYHYC